MTALGPLRQVRTEILEVGYTEAGPSDGEVVLLLHGFPYDIHRYVEVIPRLVAAGHRVIVPYLRDMDRPASSTPALRAPASRLPSAVT